MDSQVIRVLSGATPVRAFPLGPSVKAKPEVMARPFQEKFEEALQGVWVVFRAHLMTKERNECRDVLYYAALEQPLMKPCARLPHLEHWRVQALVHIAPEVMIAIYAAGEGTFIEAFSSPMFTMMRTATGLPAASACAGLVPVADSLWRKNMWHSDLIDVSEYFSYTFLATPMFISGNSDAQLLLVQSQSYSMYFLSAVQTQAASTDCEPFTVSKKSALSFLQTLITENGDIEPNVRLFLHHGVNKSAVQVLWMSTQATADHSTLVAWLQIKNPDHLLYSMDVFLTISMCTWQPLQALARSYIEGVTLVESRGIRHWVATLSRVRDIGATFLVTTNTPGTRRKVSVATGAVLFRQHLGHGVWWVETLSANYQTHNDHGWIRLCD